MAPKPHITREHLAGIFGKRGHGSEAIRIAQAAAAKMEADRGKLLGPLDVAGEYDAARLLHTTLGGQLRQITLEDLHAFSANAAKLGKRFKGGITAQGVVDHSLQVDRDRANSEIRTAIVVRAQAGLLHFITNAGPDSDVNRHHVYVEFPAFKAFAASAADPKKLAKTMLESPLKFECRCQRFTYWYRFLATKGGFVHGFAQTNYPKIRNPKLVGVACKHSLRVMQAVLKDANVRIKAAEMIAAAQKNSTKALVTTAAEAKDQAAKQLAQEDHLKHYTETTGQRAKRLSESNGWKLRAVQAATKENKRRSETQAATSRKELAKAFANLKTVPMKKAERDALIAELMAMKTTD